MQALIADVSRAEDLGRAARPAPSSSASSSPRFLRARVGRSFVFVAALAAALAAGASEARAGDKIAADKLFDDGLKQLDAGNYKAACDDFAASHKADPSVGALINLGKCNEKQGKLATAWSSYKEAVSLARKNDDKRAEDATASAAALEGKLSTLKLTAKAPVAGLTIRRDGADTGGAHDVELPIDPGEHTIEVSAPGYKAVTLHVKIGDQRDKQTLEIPPLEPVASGNPGGGGDNGGGTPGGGTPGGGTPGGGTPGGADKGGTNGLVVAGGVIGGVGAVGVVVGAIFGGLAVGAKTDVETKCPGNVCATSDGKDALSTAKTDANVSTGGLVAGGILLAGGATMLAIGIVTGKKHTTENATGLVVVPAVGPGIAGAVVGGRF
jgi:hypothetical protein